MNDCEISVNIEPKDKYEKAEKDLIQALKSLKQLNPHEQRQLACKIFGVEKVDFVIRMVQQYNMKGN